MLRQLLAWPVQAFTHRNGSLIVQVGELGVALVSKARSVQQGAPARIAVVTPQDLVHNLQATLEPQRDPTRAAAMAAYMKDLFPFLGLPSPERVALSRPLLKAAKPYADAPFLHQVALSLWELPEREYQYAAIELLALYPKQATSATLKVVEHLITHKSWWDSIDPLASKVLGRMIGRFPGWLEVMDEWSTHSNFWLRRTAILYQRGYRDHTDAQRLFRYCLANASDREFFIRKAIGWALREYSKVNPEAVRSFIGQHQNQLSPLSIREGSKYIAPI